jgi:hypothetical protein
MKLTHFLSIGIIAALFTSCTGPQGPTGPTGAAGANGANGVANITTQTYTVTAADWTDPSSNTTWVSTWSESYITDENSDAVLAYWSNATSGWLALPVSSLVTNGDELSFGYTSVSSGAVTFSYYTGG